MDRLRRRAFLGLGAAGMAGAAAAAAKLWSDTGLTDQAHAAGNNAGKAAPSGRKVVPESALPGDPRWKITQLGAAHAIEGYTGQPSVPQGGSFPLFVSTTARSFTVTAYRMGWYQGDGARKVWRSGSVRGHQQAAAARSDGTNTISVNWGPAAEIRTDDWPPGDRPYDLTGAAMFLTYERNIVKP